MSVPADLAARVSEAHAALYHHPGQTLLSWYRYAIYDALLADHSQASYAARAWIDVLSAQHVQFCWQSYARNGWAATWPQPTDLLRVAEQTLQGMAPAALIQRQIARAQALADVVGVPTTSAQYPAWCVFEAALRALQSAWIFHTCAGLLPNDRAANTVELDDASWYAAIAIAGSHALVRGDPHARTTYPDRAFAAADPAAQLRWTFFWEWWLREAIPQAVSIARSDMVL